MRSIEGKENPSWLDSPATVMIPQDPAFPDSASSESPSPTLLYMLVVATLWRWLLVERVARWDSEEKQKLHEWILRQYSKWVLWAFKYLRHVLLDGKRTPGPAPPCDIFMWIDAAELQTDQPASSTSGAGMQAGLSSSGNCSGLLLAP